MYPGVHAARLTAHTTTAATQDPNTKEPIESSFEESQKASTLSGSAPRGATFVDACCAARVVATD
jgi:hypothetical protein